jgi:hypothetical protein
MIYKIKNMIDFLTHSYTITMPLWGWVLSALAVSAALIVGTFLFICATCMAGFKF